jgi:anti-anti-sigma factor
VKQPPVTHPDQEAKVVDMGEDTVDFDRAGLDLTVHITGEIDQATAPHLLDEILCHLHDDDEAVCVDLEEVTFCGAAGVSLLMRLNDRVDAAGGRLTLYHPAPDVVRVLDACRCTNRLSIWTDAPSGATG